MAGAASRKEATRAGPHRLGPEPSPAGPGSCGGGAGLVWSASVARVDTVIGQCGRRATAKTDWPNGGRTSVSAALVTGRTRVSYHLTIGPSLGVSLNTEVAM